MTYALSLWWNWSQLQLVAVDPYWPFIGTWKTSYDFLDWGKTMRQTAASAKWQQQYFDLEVRSWSNKENMQMSLNYIANSIEMSHSAHRIVIVYCRPCLFIYRKVAWLRAKSFRWIRFFSPAALPMQCAIVSMSGQITFDNSVWYLLNNVVFSTNTYRLSVFCCLLWSCRHYSL